MEKLGIIIHNYQEHMKHQETHKNNKSKKHKKQIQITKTTKIEKHSWKQHIFQARLQKNLLQSFTKEPHKDIMEQQH